MGMRVPFMGNNPGQSEAAPPLPGWSPQHSKPETPLAGEGPSGSQSDGWVSRPTLPMRSEKFVPISKYNDLVTYTSQLQDSLASMDSRLKLLEGGNSQGQKREEPLESEKPTKKKSKGN